MAEQLFRGGPIVRAAVHSHVFADRSIGPLVLPFLFEDSIERLADRFAVASFGGELSSEAASPNSLDLDSRARVTLGEPQIVYESQLLESCHAGIDRPRVARLFFKESCSKVG